jgi:cell division protein FtsI (penicillin-binding protein 3)
MLDRRLTWVAGFVFVWGAAVFYNLIKLQIVHHDDYVREARKRQEHIIHIQATRGPIMDRTGRPLALSLTTRSVSVDPLKLPDIKLNSSLLANQLHMDEADVYGRIKANYDNHRGFLVIKHDITEQEAQNLKALNLDWIHIDTQSQRHYPKGSLAAHVLGGVDFSESGNAGIEKALDGQLRGEAGQAMLLTDARHRGIDEQLANEGRAGTAITLTIDERLQFVAERELALAVVAHGAVSGSVVVMNPYDGQILALASYPSYDPNAPPASVLDPGRANHASGISFEPGSVFKVITLAAALETTSLTPDSMINCHGGVLTLFTRTIHDSHSGMGVVPMRDVLAHSSNIGAIEIGMQVGREKMFDYVHRFGFGQKTGVPLPGEDKGRLRRLSIWGATSLASISMGQEVSVTTLQLAQAASVVANGGLMVKPRLVLKTDGQATAPGTPERVIKPETAIKMRQMMEGVVLYGTGKLTAKLDGYTSGGKTGSAQIYDFAAHRYTHSYNGSFMGFAPVTNPAVVVVVSLNGTHGIEGFGGAAAAPVFRAVATEALRIMEVPKDLPEAQPATPALVAKNGAENAAKGGAHDDLAIADLGQPNILEDPDDDDKPAAPVVGPQPPAPVPAPGQSAVPNFRGMSLRAVLAVAAARGLTVQPDGSGIARIQNPPAGAILHAGERIRVQFAR